MTTAPIIIPKQVANAVLTGNCILFLGAMVSAKSPKHSPYRYEDSERPPSGATLATYLAGLCRYSDADKENLARISLYYEHSLGFGRDNLESEVRGQVAALHIRVSPVLRMLAALPFRMCITTNYDHLFETALRETEIERGLHKNPIVIIYDPDRTGPSERVSLDPDPARPVLFKLHGDIDKSRSIVITEEDYITFIAKMATGESHHPIPTAIKARLAEWPILFIGYSLKDYNLRLLFKTIRMGLDNGGFPLSFSVDPFADKMILEVFEHGGKRLVDFLPLDVWDFVPELYKTCTGTDYPAANGSIE
jgi:hypothetical protein